MRPARPFFEPRVVLLWKILVKYSKLYTNNIFHNNTTPSATQSQFEFETPDQESISPRFFFCAAIMRADPKNAERIFCAFGI